MEIKKSPQADLEKGKGLSLLLGLVVALSVMFVTLEWRSTIAKAVDTMALNIADLDNALIVQDEQQEDQPEPEPEPQVQVEAQLPDDFKTVDNNVEVAKVTFVSADEGKPTPPPVVVAPVEEEDANQIFEIVEESTEFPGGMSEFPKYLQKNLRYPEIAAENGIQGRVIVSFVIEKDGKPSQVKVARGVDPALDKEAVRVIEGMPAWKPGKQRGKPVRQRFTLPVQFRLQ